LGLTTRSWLLSDICGFLDLGRPLWREDGSAVCNCYWPSPAQSFSGPSPVGLVAIFYCLRFETSLFIASYDSQGHGGGIRSRLHTGYPLLSVLTCPPFYNFGRTEQRLQTRTVIILCVVTGTCLATCYLEMDSFVVIRCSGNVITKPLLSNWRPLWLHYSGFQAVFTEPSPSNGHICHSLLWF
jgi:hypothetical protein